ncbi:hypothetical protein ACOBV8_09915 [Pseudoalteromonas espejiana]
MKSSIKNILAGLSLAGFSLNAAAAAVIGNQLEQKLQTMSATESAMVVVSYDQLGALSNTQLQNLLSLGLVEGVQFKSLPIIGLLATPSQISQLVNVPGVRSVYANRITYLF